MVVFSDERRRLLSASGDPSVDRGWLNSTTALRGGLAVALMAAVVPHPAQAMPQGGSVVSGNATITQTGNQLKVVQTTPKVAINWQSYGIAANEIVTYYQPNAQAIALNRVLGGGPSVINGQLNANGQLWISNPSGILFGPGARVNVGGLIATTHDLKVEDFNADRYHFQSDAQPSGIVENQGAITVAEAGLAAFVAPGVVNHGVITARLGQIALASGNEFTVDLYGDQKINLVVDNKVAQQVLGLDGKPLDALVKSDGKLFADGGRIQITAAAAKGLVDNVISVGGLVEARSVAQVNGEIVLEGDGGTVTVTGTLDASGKGLGQTGGTVTVTAPGGAVHLASTARVDVSGAAGGGQALIGGDFRGGAATAADDAEYTVRPARKPVPPAETTTIDAGAVLTADALSFGRGGEIIAWSDAATTVHGSLSARGGPQGGDGGFIETSGHWLDVYGIGVSTKAPRGRSGNWLLDPYDVAIDNSSSGTAFSVPASAQNTSYTSGATSAIKASDLAIALGYGNVTITTGSSGGSDSGNITVNSQVSWAANTLTLSAYNNILVNAPLLGSGAASLSLLYGQGAVAAGNTSFYTINTSGGGFINLPGGNNFSTTQGSNGSPKTFWVITGLGSQGSASGQDMQGINGNLSGYYALGQNIVATSTSSWNSGAGFSPLGTFTGIFDGLGNTITDLTINSTGNNIGLFSKIGASGVVRNLGLSGGNVTGGSGAQSIGMLVGENDGTVINSYSTGSVSGGSLAQNIGGLVGFNYAGAIIASGSYANGNVTGGSGASDIGGLVGYNYGTIVSGSYAGGTVLGDSGASNIGGLVGYLAGLISIGSATGTVIGGYSTQKIGGLVGYSQGTILFSNASADVGGSSGAQNIGGLVGLNYSGCTIGSGSYATGTVSGGVDSYDIGGLVGYNYAGATIGSGSYATGNVSGALNAYNIGGLVGQNSTGAVIGSGSHAAGDVSGDTGAHDIGGLVGNNTVSSIIGQDVYATGNVTVANGTITYDIGGLVGSNDGSIGTGAHYTTGTVSVGDGSLKIGGLIGLNEPAGTIGSGSYAIGSVSGGSGSHYIGGLVGENDGVIASGYATGNVSGGSGAYSLGGLVGLNSSPATIGPGSYATGNVAGGDLAYYVGGLIGENDGVISSVYATGYVTIGVGQTTAGGSAGGLVGYNNGGNISQSYATGAVSGGGATSALGGLVGWDHNGPIASSYASGSVSGGSASLDIGGLVGYSDNAAITNVYATGSVTGGDAAYRIGGLLGQGNSVTISGAFSSGAVTVGTGASVVGALIGWSYSGSTSASYWDSSINALGGIGSATNGAVFSASPLTTAQAMQSINYSGWDFSGIWYNVDGSTRPFLRSEYSTVITNAHHLQLINLNTGTNYTLANNINMGELNQASGLWNTATGFSPIAPFLSGTFDGLNHTITGLIINSSSNNSVGLFANIGSTGVVRNLGLVGGSVSGPNSVDSLGMLAGLSGGTVLNSYTTGSVSGGNAGVSIGGLIGYNSGIIGSGSYASVTVNAGTGAHGVGGLVGTNSGTISSGSYASGSVVGGSGSYLVGGLIGYNSSLGSVSNSFYDIGTVPITVGGSAISYPTVGGIYHSQYQVWSGNGYSFSGTDLTNYFGLPDGNGFYHITATTVAGGAASLANMLAFTEGGTKFILDNSIDVSGTPGFSIPYFAGIFDGNSKSITGVNLNRPNDSYVGFFDYIASTATIQNLNLPNVSVTGNYTVGGLAGYNAGSILGSFVSGTVSGGSGAHAIGGLAGSNGGTIGSGSYVSATVIGGSGAYDIGGLVGLVYQYAIIGSSSFATGSVSGDSGTHSIGGLVGDNYGSIGAGAYHTNGTVSGGSSAYDIGGLVGYNRSGATISSGSYATGNVSGGSASYYIGGLVGENDDTIGASVYASGNVTGGETLGGLVGYNYSGPIGPGSHASGNVGAGSGSSALGGLVGSLRAGSIGSGSYATGSVSGGSGTDKIGGLIGYVQSTGTIGSGSYATGGVTGDGNSSNIGGLVGKNLGMIEAGTHYTTGTVSGGTGAYDIGGLVGVNDASGIIGSGSYATGNVTDLGGAYGGTTANSIGGLVGLNNTGATVDSSSYATGNVSAGSGAYYIGGLVGDNLGAISAGAHYTAGTVSGGSGAYSVGGLVGDNSGTIGAGSYATSSVSVNDGGGQVGGLVGRNYSGTIGSGSYATGNVSGGSGAFYIGGLVGENVATMEAGVYYTTGTVSGGISAYGIGGLVGFNQIGGAIGSGDYATGTVIGSDGAYSVGGLVGWNRAAVGAGAYYKTGTVNAGSGSYDVGGLVGLNDSAATIGPGSYATGNVIDLGGAYGGTTAFGIGGLVGFNKSGATVGSGSYATGNVSAGSGGFQIGGLVGENDGTIGAGAYHTTGTVSGGSVSYNIGGLVGLNNTGAAIGSGSYATGNVSGDNGAYDIAGLVGFNSSGAAIGAASYATGNVSGGSGTYYLGGLVGYNQSSAVIGSGSYAAGNVSGGSGSYDIGGLIGENDGNFSSTYATGGVQGESGAHNIGGLVGYNNSGTISDAYALGSVSGGGASSTALAGLVGYNTSSIASSYATGHVSGGDPATSGGLVGTQTGTITYGYWDSVTTGQTSGCGSGSCAGTTTAVVSTGTPDGSHLDAYAAATYGGDFTNSSIWYQVDGRTRPMLVAEASLTIANTHQLELVNTALGGSYTVAKNIDLSVLNNPGDVWKTSGAYNAASTGYGFVPIGASFSGTFDGLNHTITGLTINSPSGNNIGLFAIIGSGHTVQNIGLIGGSVTAGPGAQNIGMLAGENDGNILNSYSTGIVSGGSGVFNIGGLVGQSYGTIGAGVYHTTGAVSGGIGSYSIGGLVGSNASGSIGSGSYATGDVSGGSGAVDVGGLVGQNAAAASIGSGSHASGTVSGGSAASHIGGLVGYNLGTIGSGGYASGNVSGGGGAYKIGGLVGENDGAIDTDGHASGNVSGDSGARYIGGLVGINNPGGAIGSGSYSTGNVSGGIDAYVIGGLSGENDSIIGDFVHASGTVSVGSGSYSIGGLVGNNYSNGSTVIGIIGSGSYATGNVSGGSGAYNVGGLVGSNAGPIGSGSYATGNVIDLGGTVGGTIAHGIGGFVGYNYTGATIGSGSYATGTVSGGSGAYNIGGFAGENDASIAGVHALGSVSGGSASYAIGGLVGTNYNASIGGSYASGTVSGSDGAYQIGGLVGWNSGSTISASHASGTVSGGSGAYDVGGLIGYNSTGGVVLSSYASETVVGGVGAYDLGGLAGKNFNSITGSYAIGSVSGGSGAYDLGGLVGHNLGNIGDSYAMVWLASGSGSSALGGLVGFNDTGTLVKDYSIGPVQPGVGAGSVGGLVGSNTGTVTYSYWDTLTSGRSTSVAGTGVTSANWSTSGPGGDSNWTSDPTWSVIAGHPYPLLAAFPYVTIGTGSDASRTYGSANPSFTGSTVISTSDSGSLSAITGLTLGSVATAASSVGTYGIIIQSVTAPGYQLDFTPHTLTVNAATLSYVASPTSITYGGMVPTLTGTVVGFLGNDTAASVSTGSLGFTTTATAFSNVGSYAVTGGGLTLTSSNYTLAQAAGNATALSITPATLTYVADPESMVAGGPLPPLTGTVTGFLGGDTLASATMGSLWFGTGAGSRSRAGSYAITGYGLTANYGNYVFAEAGGNATALTITPAPPTPTVSEPILKRLFQGDLPPLAPIATLATAEPPQSPLPTEFGPPGGANVASSLPAPAETAPLMMVASVPVLTASAAPTLAQVAQTPQVQQGVQTVSNALTTASLGGGNVHDTLVALNTGSTKLSMQEQKAVFASVPTPKLVNGLVSSSNPVDKAVGGQLQQVSGGNVKLSFADVKAVLAKGGVSGPTALTYLAMYQVVHKEAMTTLFKGALQELASNPHAADVASTPARGTRSVGGVTATDSGGLAQATVPTEAFHRIVLPNALAGTDASGRTVVRGRIENWQPGMDVSVRSTASHLQLASLDAGSIEDYLGHSLAEQVAEVPPTKIEGWSGGRQVRINGRWIFVHDDGSFEIPLPAGTVTDAIRMTVVDEHGEIHEQTVAIQPGPAGTGTGHAPQPRKIAVLFANTTYSQNGIPDLNTPGNDVAQVSAVLHNRLGFVTRVINNATKADMVEALEALHSEATENDQVFIYYAGHGYENERTGVGYWLPTDATTSSAKNWMSTKDVAGLLRRVAAKNIMLVADSCYSGSFTKEKNYEAGKQPANLNELGTLRGVMAMSSGGDEPVMDGEVNSPFARALVDRMKEIAATTVGEELYTKVKADVTANTPQTPQYGVISSAGYDPGADYLIRQGKMQVSAR